MKLLFKMQLENESGVSDITFAKEKAVAGFTRRTQSLEKTHGRPVPGARRPTSGEPARFVSMASEVQADLQGTCSSHSQARHSSCLGRCCCSAWNALSAAFSHSHSGASHRVRAPPSRKPSVAPSPKDALLLHTVTSPRSVGHLFCWTAVVYWEAGCVLCAGTRYCVTCSTANDPTDPRAVTITSALHTRKSRFRASV